MMKPKKPSHRSGSASGVDNVGGVHGARVWDSPTSAVKPEEGRSHATICESFTPDAMVQKPRQSKAGVGRSPMGQRIRDLRIARGVTQMELAVEIDVSRPHIAKMETGNDSPGREVLSAIARYFGVTMDFLQTGRLEPPENGRFVDDPEELALLDMWREIPVSERPRVARMLRAAALDKF